MYKKRNGTVSVLDIPLAFAVDFIKGSRCTVIFSYIAYQSRIREIGSIDKNLYLN